MSYLCTLIDGPDCRQGTERQRWVRLSGKLERDGSSGIIYVPEEWYPLHQHVAQVHPDMGPKAKNDPKWFENHPFGPIPGPN